MSISASQYMNIRCKAEERARRKYPNQPERAREMADSECAEYNGPYKLEPLSRTQQLELILDRQAHAIDPLTIDFTAPPTTTKRRRFPGLFRGH